jgi:hypothetical protein
MDGPNRALLDTWSPAPACRVDIFRAVELAPGEAHGFGREDVLRVEALWELLDANFVTYGYVVALRDGRRTYLQYDFGEWPREDGDGVEVIEKVEVLPMGDERYPSLQGIDRLGWSDDVHDINRHLAS